MQENKNYTLHLGSMLDVLDKMPDNSIDAVVTDPPYEINFMGKGWDNSGIVFKKETWAKVLRVLKPGGHLLAFNHSRTFHRMAVAIEDSGFQIRDTIMWLYGSGFPKSHNISIGIDKKFGAEREVVGIATKGSSPLPNNHNGQWQDGQKDGDYDITIAATDEAKQWDGWGTALKPSYEPIIMARKPLDGTIADNVLKHGVGGINIDECRVGTEEYSKSLGTTRTKNNNNIFVAFSENERKSGSGAVSDMGRFPANTIHDGSDEVTEGFPSESGGGKPSGYNFEKSNQDNTTNILTNIKSGVHFGDSGSASRFFYTAKTSKKDRDEGLGGFDYKQSVKQFNKGMEGKVRSNGTIIKEAALSRNIHPTVKPTDLMQYLIRLVTPKGGTILDPFMGSGSTGKAAMIENNERDAGYYFIGIDLEPEYIEIAEARIEYGVNYKEHKAKEEEIEKKLISDNQISFEL